MAVPPPLRVQVSCALADGATHKAVSRELARRLAAEYADEAAAAAVAEIRPHSADGGGTSSGILRSNSAAPSTAASTVSTTVSVGAGSSTSAADVRPPPCVLRRWSHFDEHAAATSGRSWHTGSLSLGCESTGSTSRDTTS